NLPGKLHVLTFRNWEYPRERRIDDDRPRTKQAVVFQVAKGVRSRGGESCWIEPACSPFGLAIRVHARHQIRAFRESVAIPRIINEEDRRNVQAGLHETGE